VSIHNHNGGLDTASHSPKKATVPIIIICFMIVLFDGLDTISVTFVAPALASIWGTSAAAMAPAFLATSIGAVIGYITAGPMALRYGEYRVTIVSVALFGVATLATALATDIVTLAMFRFITSIGLGAALPLAIGTASTAVAPRHRATAAMLITAGLSLGGVLAGALGGPLIRHFGWESVFIVGGILPLILLPAVYIYIPKVTVAATQGPRPNPVIALFAGSLGLQTILLWAFAFIVFVEAYTLLYWTPTLLINWGMAKELAPASAAAFSMGGLLGGIVLVFLVAKLGVSRSLILSITFGICFILIFGLMTLQQNMLMPLMFGIGAGILPCCVGQSALAIGLYPAHLRTTGVGCAAAAGRIGSIVGPGLGGAVISLGWSTQEIVLMAVVPSVVGIAILAAAQFLIPKTDSALQTATPH
jgi:MFS transporter, AAHS family, 4-hydroxybenzoate transporter